MNDGERPSDAPPLSRFDRFASVASAVVGRAWFFAICVALIVLWAPTFIFMNIDTWQLVVNTITTIITYLLVALLQNTQARADSAVQRKLNALADGLIDVMEAVQRDDETLRRDVDELRQAVGLEHREGT